MLQSGEATGGTEDLDRSACRGVLLYGWGRPWRGVDFPEVFGEGEKLKLAGCGRFEARVGGNANTGESSPKPEARELVLFPLSSVWKVCRESLAGWLRVGDLVSNWEAREEEAAGGVGDDDGSASGKRCVLHMLLWVCVEMLLDLCPGGVGVSGISQETSGEKPPTP